MKLSRRISCDLPVQWPTKQRGQAFVFALLFLSALLLSLNFLYKAGRLTSDKMEMQNAADAAAYSVALTEARDLNFAAYTNRAMVANEVAIGQFVGLASWAFHWKSIGRYLPLYFKPLLIPPATPVGAPINSVVGAISKVIFTGLGNGFVKVMKPLAKYGIKALHTINKLYGFAQFGFHTASLVQSFGVIDKTIEDNAPDGTRVSGYGWAALAAHFASYGSLPLPVPGGTFTKSYNPNPKKPDKKADYDKGKKGEIAGYERLAAIIRDSRDPFTRKRGWVIGLFSIPAIQKMISQIPVPGPVNVSFEDGKNLRVDVVIPLLPDPPFPRNELVTGIGKIGGDLNYHFSFGINLEREGGSELRLVLPIGSTGSISGEAFNWSGADATVMAVSVGAGGGGSAWFEPLIGPRVGIDVITEMSVVNDQLEMSVGIEKPFKYSFINFPPPAIPLPSSAPFGAGFAQAQRPVGKFPSNRMKQLPDMVRTPGGPLPWDAYGDAASRTLAWPVVAVEANNPLSVVSRKYHGLPRYVDVANDSTLLGFGAPSVTISLVMDEEDWDKTRSRTDTPEARAPEIGCLKPKCLSEKGSLVLEEKMAGGHLKARPQLHSLARAEVYFARPKDLKYLTRKDGRTEAGSAFNPYWHARLTEARHVDKTLGLLAQQQEDFTGIGAVLRLFQ